MGATELCHPPDNFAIIYCEAYLKLKSKRHKKSLKEKGGGGGGGGEKGPGKSQQELKLDLLHPYVWGKEWPPHPVLCL